MTKDECLKNDQARMTQTPDAASRSSALVIRHSFVIGSLDIRHSTDSLLRQRPPEEPQPIAVEDGIHIRVAVAALREDALERLEITVDAEVDRGLLVSEAAVQI